MPASQFTPARAQFLLRRITRDDHTFAPELFELLRGVVDPDGDQVRFGIGDEVMKQVLLMTPQFEEWYRDQLAA